MEDPLEDPPESPSSLGSISSLPSPANSIKDPDFLPPDADDNPSEVLAVTPIADNPAPVEYDQKIVSGFIIFKYFPPWLWIYFSLNYYPN